MSLATINDLLPDFGSGALAGLVCLGWEEVRAFVEAAEAENAPAILMVGPGARASMPLPIWGAMLREMAEVATVPIVVHLDHGKTLGEVQLALDSGFSSVMYDGSTLPLEENIQATAQMVEMARRYGASTEGEIGFVGYAKGQSSQGSDPDEAARFLLETGVDLLAVSVGNTHLQTEAEAKINWQNLKQIAALGAPLVIHGGSGVSVADRQKMACEYNVRKFNIGTEIRQVFGKALRQNLDQNPESFDHLQLMKGVHEPLVIATRRVIRDLKGNENEELCDLSKP